LSEFLLSPLAAADLESIGDYRSARNERAAAAVIERFWEVSQMLSQNPKVGQARPDIARELRHFPMRPYIVLYREIESGVEIVRFIDGRRDLRELTYA
jgi:toxin ParE1/3/4